MGNLSCQFLFIKLLLSKFLFVNPPSFSIDNVSNIRTLIRNLEHNSKNCLTLFSFSTSDRTKRHTLLFLFTLKNGTRYSKTNIGFGHPGTFCITHIKSCLSFSTKCIADTQSGTGYIDVYITNRYKHIFRLLSDYSEN